jgi:peptidoglycan/xylan/chitin deacetylase (PgdA/CDA1 family)
MNPARLLKNYYRWNLVTRFARRDLRMENRCPMISFTFDDFPRSALQVGGEILRAQGFAGTYYACLGLVDRDSPVGRIFSGADLEDLLAHGHELGCHTFGHCPAWNTEPEAFEASILENRRALARLLPRASFKTLSYPINLPRLRTKRRAGRHFACCRGGGGQTFNRGTIDLNNLQAFFLEMSRDRPESIRKIIDRNCAARGWLVLATHDIDDRPTRFGCTPALFDKVVRWAADSGARILPVARALEEIAPQHTCCAANDLPMATSALAAPTR